MAQLNDAGKRVVYDFTAELERKIEEMTFPQLIEVFAQRKKELEEEARRAEATEEKHERDATRPCRKRKRPDPELFFTEDDDDEEADDLHHLSTAMSSPCCSIALDKLTAEGADATRASTHTSLASDTYAASTVTEQAGRSNDSNNASGAPKSFSALSLKAASKRKGVGTTSSAPSKRPFAPPQKAAKKPGKTQSTQTLNNHVHLHRGNLQALKHFRTLVNEAEVKCAKQDIPEVFEHLRTRLHVMEFYGFLSDPDAKALIDQSKILDDDAGLPAVCFRSALTGVRYPVDIRLDCRALFLRWKNGNCDPHLLRGITSMAIKKQDGKSTRHHKIDPDYQFKMRCSYFGPGELEIGQWWPMQLCAMRDGAHGEIEAGIHGKIDQGAFSIVVSGGGYANIDNGDTLEYCGTSGSKDSPTANTNYMLKSFREGKQIRVLRSSSLRADNSYRPVKGLRYDGLYVIDSFEVLDEGTAMHRFKMSRVHGQTPIRYQGVGARPNEEELSQFAKIKELFGK